MKKTTLMLFSLAFAAALCLMAVAGCGTSSSSSSSTSTSSSSSTSTSASAASSSTTTSSYSAEGHELHHAVVSVEGYDSFTITLDATVAPITVQNFMDLAKSGFYDGLTFHRIVDGFCLQGGDPKGNGTGGSSTTIKGEFSENGVDNALADNFSKGVVAMARSSAADSASSQFFITLATSSSVSKSLNGKYAAFGTIDEEGMKVVAAIVSDYKSKAAGSSGTISDTADQPRIASISITD